MSDRKPIHTDIPTEQAWKVGRRIYVRCGYKSTLNEQMRGIGAKWDSEERALWVGSGKLDKVVPLVQAHAARVGEVQDLKKAGRLVRIPFQASEIRAKAKELGGVWDSAQKQWAMPSVEALTQIQALIRDRNAKFAEQEKAVRQRRAELAAAGRQRDAETARLSEAERIQQIIDGSGRTVTDERGTAEGRVRGRMRRPEAEQAKPKPGSVRQLRNGKRVLVLDSSVNFVSQDDIDDGLWHDPIADPGWYYSYRYAVVEPTVSEREQDEREAAEIADGKEIDLVFTAARKAVTAVEHDTGTRVEGPSIVTVSTAAGLYDGHDGRLTLTNDGTLHWYHPGFYDDWRSTAGVVADEQIVAQVRTILAGGARRRHMPGDPIGRGYEVRP